MMILQVDRSEYLNYYYDEFFLKERRMYYIEYLYFSKANTIIILKDFSGEQSYDLIKEFL